MQPREDDQNPQQPEDLTINQPQNDGSTSIPVEETPATDQPNTDANAAAETTPEATSPETTTPEVATPESAGGITFGDSSPQQPVADVNPEPPVAPETNQAPDLGAPAAIEPEPTTSPDLGETASTPGLTDVPGASGVPVTSEDSAPSMQPAEENQPQAPESTPQSGEMGMVPPMAPQAGGKSNKKRILILTAVLVLVLAIGAAAYWFFLRPEAEDSANLQETNQVAENVDEDLLPESILDVVELENKVIEDSEMGYKVTVTRMVPDFPVANTNWNTDNDAVLVEFMVETDGTYNTGVPGDGNLRLIPDGGIGSLTTALISNEEIKAQGFTPFPDAPATKDNPAVGFLAFAVPKNTEVLVARYERMAATNTTTNEAIPAKNFDIVIR